MSFPPADGGLAADQRRTARLLFDRELLQGDVDAAELEAPAVRAATAAYPMPPRPLRVVQQAMHKLGWRSYERDVVRPLLRARRAILGERAQAPPRFLVRVDEFPHYRAWDEPRRFGTATFERFHAIMQSVGVPYLIAVLPRVSRDPLSPAPHGSRPLEQDELGMLARLASDGVELALHGYSHRTRQRSPRRHSELCGLSRSQTEELLTLALAELGPSGVAPRVFVPPFNRFDAAQLPVLARHFEVVCGGPESIGSMGFQRTPQSWGKTVYLPSYPPFYGRSGEVLGGVGSAIERSTGLWVPVVLHWGWEMEDDWKALERLVGRMAQHATRWEDFLAAAKRSRETGR